MILNTLRAVIILVALSATTPHASLITSIDSLDIDGTVYDVTFQTTSFNELFDPDADGILGEGGGAIINRNPTFFGDSAGATRASNAIIEALGTVDHIGTVFGNRSDSFIIPTHATFGILFGGIGDTDISTPLDMTDRFNDFNLRVPPRTALIATFQEVDTVSSVPTPPTFALAGLALALMGVFGRRRRVS